MDILSRRRCLGLLGAAPALLAALSLPAGQVQAQSLPPRSDRLRPWEPLRELPLLAAALQRFAQAAQGYAPWAGEGTRPPAQTGLAAVCPTWRLGLQRTEQALVKLQADARLLLAHLPDGFPERGRREALSSLADEIVHNSYVLATAIEGLFPLLKALPDKRAIEQVREIIFVLAFAQRARGYTVSTVQVALRRWRSTAEGWEPAPMRALLQQALEAIELCRVPLAELARLQPPLLEESAQDCAS